MLNVGKIENGIVMDHITAGRAMEIYRALKLDEKDCGVAIIQNARSEKNGRKDILKIEDLMEDFDFDILGYIDPDITINVIRDGERVEKRKIEPKKKLVNVLSCQNPQCITTIEQELKQVFILSEDEVASDGQKRVYRCAYCEQRFHRKKDKK